MSVPPAPYLRLTSFVGSSPYRDATLGVAMDEEFDSIQVAINAVENRLSLIQRDDGDLLNGSVGPDQLGGGLTGQQDFTLVNSFGINSVNVAPNVLTVKGPSALFANALGGGDFKLFLSKNVAGNSASLIFQDAFSSRAEISLFGDDNLHFRMSTDGAAFIDALGISTTGIVTAITPSSVDSSNRLATTAFVATSFAPKLNPTFTGTLTTAALSVSGAITGGGMTSLFASPPPIGATVPGTGAFTTLDASGAVTGAGFTARLATPGPIGNTAPSTGAFTTLTASQFTTLTTATIGDQVTDTISFYGGTPVARRAAGNNAVVPAGGVGVAGGGWSSAADRNIAIATINEIRATLVGLGLMPST